MHSKGHAARCQHSHVQPIRSSTARCEAAKPHRSPLPGGHRALGFPPGQHTEPDGKQKGHRSGRLTFQQGSAAVRGHCSKQTRTSSSLQPIRSRSPPRPCSAQSSQALHEYLHFHQNNTAAVAAVNMIEHISEYALDRKEYLCFNIRLRRDK